VGGGVEVGAAVGVGVEVDVGGTGETEGNGVRGTVGVKVVTDISGAQLVTAMVVTSSRDNTSLGFIAGLFVTGLTGVLGWRRGKGKACIRCEHL
jgi:hypothetical protein